MAVSSPPLLPPLAASSAPILHSRLDLSPAKANLLPDHSTPDETFGLPQSGHSYTFILWLFAQPAEIGSHSEILHPSVSGAEETSGPRSSFSRPVYIFQFESWKFILGFAPHAFWVQWGV